LAETSNTNITDLFQEPPPAPKRKPRFFVLLGSVLLLLAWSFDGAKLRPGELVDGIPEIATTLGRMLPPDFSKITDPRSYHFPEILSIPELFLPVSLSEEEARLKQRWWDNTFPQTIVGATLETVQMALAGTCLALVAAFPLGFLAARNTTPHPAIYYGVRGLLNLLRTIPDLALGLLFVAAVGLGAFAGTLALAKGMIMVVVRPFLVPAFAILCWRQVEPRQSEPRQGEPKIYRFEKDRPVMARERAA